MVHAVCVALCVYAYDGVLNHLLGLYVMLHGVKCVCVCACIHVLCVYVCVCVCV